MNKNVHKEKKNTLELPWRAKFFNWHIPIVKNSAHHIQGTHKIICSDSCLYYFASGCVLMHEPHSTAKHKRRDNSRHTLLPQDWFYVSKVEGETKMLHGELWQICKRLNSWEQTIYRAGEGIHLRYAKIQTVFAKFWGVRCLEPGF